MSIFSKKQKVAIKLFGIGGNFKTSIIESDEFKDYLKIPEFNREAGELICRFKEIYTTPLNLVSKYLLIKTVLKSKNTKFICDRSLIDYGIMNQLIINYLDHYFGASNDKLTIEEAVRLELDAYSECKSYNILLVNKDKEFIQKIIDNSWDERANFYDNSECYLKCQEVYVNIIKSNFDRVLVIEFDDMSDPHWCIDHAIRKIKEYVK